MNQTFKIKQWIALYLLLMESCGIWIVGLQISMQIVLFCWKLTVYGTAKKV